jgi:hypothetical protein
MGEAARRSVTDARLGGLTYRLGRGSTPLNPSQRRSHAVRLGPRYNPVTTLLNQNHRYFRRRSPNAKVG